MNPVAWTLILVFARGPGTGGVSTQTIQFPTEAGCVAAEAKVAAAAELSVHLAVLANATAGKQGAPPVMAGAELPVALCVELK